MWHWHMNFRLVCVSAFYIWTKDEAGAPWQRWSPPVKYFYWKFQDGASFVDHLCYLCFVFAMLLCLFIAALWSSEGKGMTFWLMLMMFIVILLLSHLVSWDSCGIWLYWFPILAVSLAFTQWAHWGLFVLFAKLQIVMSTVLYIWSYRIFC